MENKTFLPSDHLDNGIFVHHESHIEKLLKHFYMDKSHTLSIPMMFDHWMCKRFFKTSKMLKCFSMEKSHVFFTLMMLDHWMCRRFFKISRRG